MEYNSGFKGLMGLQERTTSVEDYIFFFKQSITWCYMFPIFSQSYRIASSSICAVEVACC